MTHPLSGVWRRGTVALLGSALVFTGLGPVTAAASPIDLPAKNLPQLACAPGGPTTAFTVLGFNDFHGRIATATKVFTEVETVRQQLGEGSVLTISSGDNIGGSTFESASQDDKPTLDVLNAGALDVSTVGNHEFDKGWSDLSGRVVSGSTFPYLGANVYTKGTTTVAAPLKEYQLFDRAGLTVAVVGAVTADLPSLVSPDGIADLTIGDPVAAVNRVAAQLKDGDPGNGEADIVIASFHEGAPDGTKTAAENAAESTAFASIYSGLTPNTNLVLNAHTHQTYTWTTSAGVGVVQAGSYGEKVVRVDLVVDTDDHQVCSTTPTMVLTSGITENTSFQRVAAIKTIVDDAIAEAEVKGAEVIGNSTGPITLPGALMTPDQRDKESPATNLVAQMFFDVLGKGNPEFIGIQNPGGTRAGIDQGDVTYKEAALTLPFANTLQTTELTGAQFKKVLEQQWQRDASGNVPSRPYLRLGLSSNVSYSYDESRPEGDRITAITINGAPIDPAKLYTVGSGNFLIAGGDNFTTMADGQNTRDSGQVDLTAMVDWVKGKATLTPDYTMRGVSVRGLGPITPGTPFTVTVGAPTQGGLAVDTLNSTGANAPGATSVSYTLSQGTKSVSLGTSQAQSGSSTGTLTVPTSAGFTSGAATLTITSAPTGTIVAVPVQITPATAPGTTYAWGDQTGDRVGDIITITSDGRMLLVKGKVGGLVSPAQVIGQGWQSFTWIGHTPDVTGDGIDDLLGRRSDGKLFLYASRGQGIFASAREVGHGWNGITTMGVIGDMDGNKSPELVGIAADGRLIRYTITASGLVGTTVIGRGWGGMTSLIGVGSVDAGTTPDIVAVRADGGLYVYYTGGGQITKSAKVGQGWNGFSQVFAPGDLTGDGRPDIVGINGDSNALLYGNRGGGAFGPGVDISTPSGMKFVGSVRFG